jgi:hypothetical protein
VTRFTLQRGTCYACELIGDEFDDDKRSYSPIKVYSVQSEKNGDRTFVLKFYHALYPEGVRDKTYKLRTIERGRSLFLAKSLEHSPPRFLLIYDITAEWVSRHFPGYAPSRTNIQQWLEKNV